MSRACAGRRLRLSFLLALTAGQLWSCTSTVLEKRTISVRRMVLDLYQQQFFENVIRFHDETAAMPALMILRQVQVRAVSTPSFSYKLPYDAVDPTSQNREADLTVQITSDQLIKAWPVLEAQDLRDLKRLLMVWSRQVSVGDCSWDPAPDAAVWICLDPQTRPGTQRAETAWSYKGLYQGRDVWVHSARFATAFQEFLRAPARTNRQVVPMFSDPAPLQ